MSSQNSRQEALEIPLSLVLSKCSASLCFHLVFKILGDASLPPLRLHKSPGLRNTKKYFTCVILLDPELHSSVSNSFLPSVLSGCLSALWVGHFLIVWEIHFKVSLASDLFSNGDIIVNLGDPIICYRSFPPVCPWEGRC